MRCSSLLALSFAALSTPLPLAAQTPQPDLLRLPWSQWAYHAGDDPQCSQIDASGCTLQTYRVDDWSRQNLWQRTEVTLPPTLQSIPQLGLLVQGEYPVYEVFINGQRIGGSGNIAERRGPQAARAIFNFPASLARQGRLLIAIHTLGLHTADMEPGLVPTLAPSDRIQTIMDEDTLRYLRTNWLHFACYVAMFGIGVVFFLLFAVNTRAHEYFWLGARLCALLILRMGEFASVVDLSIPSRLALAFYALLNATSTFISIEFVFSFLGRPVPKIFRAIQIVGAVYGASLLLLLPWPSPIFFAIARITEGKYVHHIAIAMLLLAALTFLLLLPACFKSKLPEMRWIGAAVLFLTLEESNRMAGFIHLPSLPQDFFWHGFDIDLRALSNLLFASVMLVAMTFRFRRIQDRNRAIEQEMAAARGVQQILIPDELPSVPGLVIESAYMPAQEVGGDFFQILPIPNAEGDPEKPSAFIVLGDVSGKGLKAAMTVSLIVGTLRTYAEFCTGPAELLAGLNRRLHGRGDGFSTCLALMITPGGRITLANAAHPNPYLDGAEIETEPNLPLGLTLDVAYSEIVLQLKENQRLTLVTDGVVEATHAATRELFGFDRTQSISHQPASAIAHAARAFGQGAPQADDITVLTVARAGFLTA
ncbi:MAG: PP2C family protein-serine/threonine phosphatase [Terracidiphilus sp.]|jgi:hypothetical protein